MNKAALAMERTEKNGGEHAQIKLLECFHTIQRRIWILLLIR